MSFRCSSSPRPARSGETLVRGALELRVKESDRLAAMAEGLSVLGVEHQLLPDGLWIRGAEASAAARIDSRGDHRIAMAFAVAALRARAPIEIADVANVATSFPGFVARGARGRLAPWSRCDDTAQRCRTRLPGRHHRRSERLGQGHHQPRRCAPRRAGTCSTAARSTGWWRSRAPLAGSRRTTSPATPGSPRDMAVDFGGGADEEERMLLDGRDVTAQVRSEAAGQGASRVAAWPQVRAALLERQRAFARPPGLVADGRDMGTVVFPGADLKIFLTASARGAGAATL